MQAQLPILNNVMQVSLTTISLDKNGSCQLVHNWDFLFKQFSNLRFCHHFDFLLNASIMQLRMQLLCRKK